MPASILRPFRGDMLSIAAELKNVPLGETHVLEQHPCGVGKFATLTPMTCAGQPAKASAKLI